MLLCDMLADPAISSLDALTMSATEAEAISSNVSSAVDTNIHAYPELCKERSAYFRER